VLPEGNSARVAAETINSDFSALGGSGFKIVISGDPDPAAVQAFVAKVSDVPGVDTAQATSEPKNGVWPSDLVYLFLLPLTFTRSLVRLSRRSPLLVSAHSSSAEKRRLRYFNNCATRQSALTWPAKRLE